MLVDSQGNDHGLLVDDMKVVIERSEWFVPDTLIERISPEATGLLEHAVEATPDQIARFKDAAKRFQKAKNDLIDIAFEIDETS